ncbi:MAG TPA: oxidoreductase, partial [Cyanobacteria bacterium UBA9579]|nr:oxidoreductase [Cyanobacteria bacterium UBA9579]
MKHFSLTIIGVLLLINIISCQIQENQQEPEGRVAAYTPQQRPFSEDLLKQLKLPEGFQINVFTKGLENPRMIAVNNYGTVYITQPDAGNVIKLRDTNNDGTADQKDIVVSGLQEVHGITIHNNKLYLATPTEIYNASINEQGNIGSLNKLPCTMPPGEQHPNRTLAFGPDGMLYVSVGSSCNACVENNPKYASILKMQPDGTNCQIYATGLRNTIGFDWHPVTEQMWGMDQGSDWRGANIPPEELNKL